MLVANMLSVVLNVVMCSVDVLRVIMLYGTTLIVVVLSVIIQIFIL
jgi:hypothetical protein